MIENIEMLKYLYESASMGAQSLTHLIKELAKKDNKIKDNLDDIKEKYEYFMNTSAIILRTYKEEFKEDNKLNDLSTSLGLKLEVIKDNSDSRIADMLIKGLTIGKVEIEKKLKVYNKKISGDAEKLAKEYKDFQSKEIEKLKKYL